MYITLLCFDSRFILCVPTPIVQKEKVSHPILVPRALASRKNYSMERVDVPQSNSERFEEEKDLLLLLGL
jgi:hypothetical protein